MTKYLFVSDFFIDQYTGGAELTSEALINANKEQVTKVKSSEITRSFILQNNNKTWIFGNFAFLNRDLLMVFIKSNIKYFIVEYDFKFCKYRSPEKHISAEKSCDCPEQISGKLISLFFSKANKVFYMSENQKKIYESKFSFLLEKGVVLSSIFSDETLNRLATIDVPRDDKWLILKSDSWIKGTDHCVAHANANNLKYRLVGNLSYDEMLDTLGRSRGLIFLPLGGDTCPRIVIEARLMGCELILNDNVLHKDEDWFNKTPDKITEYLKSRPQYFWSLVEKLSL